MAGDYYRIGRWRISKRRVRKRLNLLISLLIVFLFLSTLLVLIFTGQRY